MLKIPPRKMFRGVFMNFTCSWRFAALEEALKENRKLSLLRIDARMDMKTRDLEHA